MKSNKVFNVLVASALVTSVLAAGTAEAAATTKPATKAPAKVTSKAPVAKAPVKLKVSSVSFKVNGETVAVNSVQVKNTTLVALGDLVKVIGAKATSAKGITTLSDASALHTLVLQSGSKTYKLDNEALAFAVAPLLQDNRTYVELEPVVNALGGEIVSQSGSSKEILTVKRIAGSFASPRFDSEGNVIAVLEDGEVPQVYKLKSNYSSQLLASDSNAADMAISPNGQWGAYADDKGQLSLISLTGGQTQLLGQDTTVKTDLNWSADGKSIYFVQGDKQEKISYITLDTGKITEVLADKVENKSDVRVSADGKKIVYIVNITGVAKNDKDSTEDSLSIDYSGAGEQFYSLAVGTKDAKPVQLTTSNDNKLFPILQADGKLLYLSADPDNSNAKNVLKAVNVDGKTQDVINDIDVTVTATNANGQLAVAGIAADGKTKVYTVSASGSKTEVYSTDADISELSLSVDGSQLVAIVDGKIVLIQNGGKSLQLSL
ncbi:stalk domain-containing protein [Paenibacillus pini]|uniref:Copper amine oxidase-like N-terminal domain-containing protein n=1 Tax=Paenibacillus pini JCM 16418 TaxID=1236976 RepID=W7Z6Q0_9BACL|nr:stalk domain-containing protein [Paenibacillus pini]GAF09999.1 hypothetical protein JCM16418_4169 [Paenibacillus pini JCM 16418]